MGLIVCNYSDLIKWDVLLLVEMAIGRITIGYNRL